jgi:hypothetical protein
VQAETEKTLRLVISKGTKLRESRFAGQLESSGYRIEFRQQDIHVTKPDDEARDAFILTLRFFTLGNERTSFCRLADLLGTPDVSQEWKDSFATLRSSLNDYMATAYGEYQYDGQPHRFTNWEIVDTFLYGGLAHANNDKTVARYEEWTRHPGLYELLEFWFVSAVKTLLQAISLLASMCERELAQTSGLAGGTAGPADGSGPTSG